MSQQAGLSPAIAASRTLPWLHSGWGYEGWVFARANGTNDLGVGQELTLAFMPDAFDLAVEQWNKQGEKIPLQLHRIGSF